MSEKETGGPAFPVSTTHEEIGHQDTATTWQFPGMTLRDYFAGKAMQGICASRDEAGVLLAHGYEWIASEAFKIADALLKERAV